MDMLDLYRQRVHAVAKLEDAWFLPALALCRAGDDASRRRIAGSSLRHVLDAVERRGPCDRLLEHVQDANATIYIAIDSFAGASTDEFVSHLQQIVNRKLDELIAA